MSRYSAYDNELTRYIDLITKISIKDIIGNLIGDVIDVDIPVNLPKDNATITASTPNGEVEIEIITTTNKIKFKKYSKTSVIIKHKIGNSTYEEYTFDLDDDHQEFLVKGFILEERDRGLIITRNERLYDYRNNKGKLIKLDERRTAYSYKAINEAYKEIGMNIEECPIEKKHSLLKELCICFPIEEPGLICKTNIDISIPDYDRNNPWNYNQRYYVNINNMPKEHFYRFLTGEKILERVDDLLHGNINSHSLNDLKILLSCTDDYEKRKNSNGFNLLLGVKATSKDVMYDTLATLEEEQLGSSKITLERSYYEYLHELLLDTFDVELRTSLKPNDVVELIKTNYRRWDNEEK